MNGLRYSGGIVRQSGALAWAPTLTEHDPNPPLPLESKGSGPTYYGILKRWTGSAWVKAKLLVHVGGAWVAKPLKRWTGTAWVEVDATGV